MQDGGTPADPEQARELEFQATFEKIIPDAEKRGLLQKAGLGDELKGLVLLSLYPPRTDEGSLSEEAQKHAQESVYRMNAKIVTASPEITTEERLQAEETVAAFVSGLEIRDVGPLQDLLEKDPEKIRAGESAERAKIGAIHEAYDKARETDPQETPDLSVQLDNVSGKGPLSIDEIAKTAEALRAAGNNRKTAEEVLNTRDISPEDKQKIIEAMPSLTEQNDLITHMKYLKEKKERNEPFTGDDFKKTADAFVQAGVRREQAVGALQATDLSDEEKKRVLDLIPEMTEEQAKAGDKGDAKEADTLQTQVVEQKKSIEEQILDFETQAAKEHDPDKKSKMQAAAARAREKFSGLEEFFTEATAKDWGRRAFKTAVIAALIAAFFIIWEMQLIGRVSKK